VRVGLEGPRLPRWKMRVFPIDPMEVCSWLFGVAQTLIVSPVGGSAPPATSVVVRLFGAEYEWLLAVMVVLVVWQAAGLVGLLRGPVRRTAWLAGTFAWGWVLLGGLLTAPDRLAWTLYVPIVMMKAWTYVRARARNNV
jgi:hypothetical protein